MSNQKFLKKQIAQANLNEMCTETYLDESLNISKLPLLFVTPENTRINRTSTINHLKTNVIQYHLVESPIESNTAQSNTISTMDLTNDLTYYNAFSNQLYVSPLIQRKNRSINSTSSFDSQTFQDELSANCSESEQFYTVNGSFFDNDTTENSQVYVCCQSFQATESNELSLDIAEKVKLIYSKEEFCLVQHLANGKRGFVPKSSISAINQPWINSNCLSL